jgi:hypothetical protein
MTPAESAASQWYGSPLVLELNDGTTLLAMRDDEGNDAGALLHTGQTDDEVFPVIHA